MRQPGSPLIIVHPANKPFCILRSGEASPPVKSTPDCQECRGASDQRVRHTFATEMITHGMRVEFLQQILGHQDIEMTMRYARLSNQRREADYYRAMAVIQGGEGSDEPYRRSTALQKVFEERTYSNHTKSN